MSKLNWRKPGPGECSEVTEAAKGTLSVELWCAKAG